MQSNDVATMDSLSCVQGRSHEVINYVLFSALCVVLCTKFLNSKKSLPLSARPASHLCHQAQQTSDHYELIKS